MRYAAYMLTVLLLCLSALGPALAQTPPPAQAPTEKAPSGTFFENLEASSKQIASKATVGIASDLKAAGLGIANQLKTPALAVAGSLALLYLIVEITRLMGTKSSMFTPLFDVGIPCILAAFLITRYGDHLQNFDKLLELFRNLGASGPGAVGGAGSDPTGQIMDMYGKVIGMVGQTVQESLNRVSDGGFMKLLDAAFYAALLDMLITMLFALIIFVFCLIGLADVLGLLLLGPFLFAIGVAFGPLLIAGVVTPWTRDYFKKWVQFLVASAALTGVVRVILLIGTTIFEKLAITGYAESGTPTAVTMTIVAIMVMAVNSLISQAPAIASALVPGHLGASAGSGKAISAASGMAGGGAKKAASTAAGAGGKGVKWAGAAIKKAKGTSPSPAP